MRNKRLSVRRGRLGKLCNEKEEAFDILCRGFAGCFNSAQSEEREENDEEEIREREESLEGRKRGRIRKGSLS